MNNSGIFNGKTAFISGGSRGIGKAIALKLAKDGANIAIAAKTIETNSKLLGTIFSAAEEIEAVGGKCLPIQCDIRDESDVKNAIEKTVQHFGGLDIVVNNAGAVSMSDTEQTSMKKFDVLYSVNTRGTFMASKYAIPHLKKSSNPHILNITPPLVMEAKAFQFHGPYTLTKYGMSMCALQMSEELKDYGIAVNALWPRTAIWTAAMVYLGGGREETAQLCRKVDIMADSAYGILSKDSKSFTANFLIDEDFLISEGIEDIQQYSVQPGSALLLDFLLPDEQSRKGDNVLDIHSFIGSVTSDK